MAICVPSWKADVVLETNACASERGINAESPTCIANIPAWLLRLDPMMPANESGLLWNSHVDVVPSNHFNELSPDTNLFSAHSPSFSNPR